MAPSILFGTDVCCDDSTATTPTLACERYIDNIADLRQVVIADGDMLSTVVGGSAAAGDGLGDVYVWNGASTAADDGVTVITPNGNVGSGRWVLVNSARASTAIRPLLTAQTTAAAANILGVVPALSPIQFGAAGDGVTDDYAAIQAMVAAANVLQMAGHNVLMDCGNYLFATSGPLVMPSNTVLRNYRAKALPSNNWIGRQAPADLTTNGMVLVPPSAINILIDNCNLDCQGIMAGAQANLVVNCSGITVQQGAANIHVENCSVRNPSTAQACMLVQGSATIVGCHFVCVDTGNVATYTACAIRFEWIFNVNTQSGGAGNCTIVACDFVNGVFQIYIAPGCFRIYFVAACSFSSAGGGPNAGVGGQIWGHDILFADCVHESTLRYSTGGTYTNAAGAQTQIGVDLRVLHRGGALGANPPLILQAQTPNSTLDAFRYGYGSHPAVSPNISFQTAAGGSWAYNAAYTNALGAVGVDIIITPSGLPLFVNSGSIVTSNYSDDLHESLAAFAPLGAGAPAFAPGPAFGAHDADAIMKSGDTLSYAKVTTAGSSEGIGTLYAVNAAVAGPIGGVDVKFTTYDPNNTASRFFSGTANSNLRFIVFSNGNVANTNNSYAGISDARMKSNIVTAPEASDKLAQLRVTNFTLTGDTSNTLRTDLIAQEVLPVFPDAIVADDSSPPPDDTGPLLMLAHNRLVPYLIQGWQEERTARLALDARVAALEAAAHPSAS